MIKSTEMVKIKNIIREEISKYLLNEVFNYHISKDDIDITKNNIVHNSEGRNSMGNNERNTGYFGSGTYFSTYKDSDFNKKYNPNNDFNYPYFIKIDKRLYRVDLDIYNNLYKVNTEQEGMVLYTTLKTMHKMFKNIENNNLNNALLYQIIIKNCKGLGLKCPSYKHLSEMMKDYSKSNNRQTFPTFFMEQNGYNGVNVSGIDFFDNTTHGSVVYNLNNISLEPIAQNKHVNAIYSPYDSGMKQSKAETSVIQDDMYFPDLYTKTLFSSGNSDLTGILTKSNINQYSKKQQKRIVLNFIDNNRFLSYSEIKLFDVDVIKFYMRYLYIHKPTLNNYNFEETLKFYNLIDIIDEYNLLYWVNENFGKNSILIHMLYNNTEYKDRAYREKYLKMLLSYMKRPLTKEEKDYIDNEYYDED